ncbi:tripartite ATP-independent transporter solute receptor, DctP family [Meinhardsimonia xiamenensis]|jgi:tripartite ATP-independent transporter DctP family solute receptor|uniref:Tripartite ATP-independent transporter solute receptor, DctP family n=1 Tax=Meinhardsimonia xiamenensis TaxID=990712 RepID=A0A1G9DCU6_9RHOB|nr:C4-dicarboxylate TRAP transporter substrate-binding protein [Meinhardsimonia xiamenensis]PRX38038.1 tripartite ATP-independent transporter DctP family solute receptor [Meinhardsimonia xiamenensis]SDK61712.1 tripartite ATP-independent transporter solute receptor, DctP family [Meinhardsimonia xiamenensis]
MTAMKTTIAALAVSAATALAAQAQESWTLRFNHVLGPNEPFHKGFLAWADRVAERTGGRLKIDVYHSSQLGVEEDIIEQIRQGANVGQNTDAARLGNYVPGIAVVNGPYMVANKEEAFALADSPTMQGWIEELAEDHGIRVVCFDWVQGQRHFFTNRPVRAPEDLDGLRIRTPPAPIWQESIRALGATPVAMNFGDIYTGLQSRAVDGAELVYTNITAANLNEVLSHANETGHILLVNFQIVSEEWFDGLPEDVQAALTEECRAAGQETSAVIADALEAAKAELVRRGMTIVEDVDLEAFRKAGEKAYEVLGLTEARAKVLADMGR